MSIFENYVMGAWISGDGVGQPLYNAYNGDVVGYASTKGLDYQRILDYGRSTGSPKLRNMSFYERGLMLKKLALYLTKRKDDFYAISYKTGATKLDSWIDIEGGFGNLFANASLRRKFTNQAYHVDGEPIDLARGGPFMGHHIMVPKRGVAVHINAYNFPVWGMLEKCACNWMAGVAAVVKPATVTSYLTHAVVKAIVESGILPKGALQLICGSAGNLLDYVDDQDVVTFTGSAETGKMLKAHPRIIERSVPFNMEADSLNCAVLGQHAYPGTPEFDLFVKEVAKEMTVKCGQKCTAIRRAMVPSALLPEVQEALISRLKKVVIGNPSLKEVRMGALAGKNQVKEVHESVAKLAQQAELVYGSEDHDSTLIDADKQSGAFMLPTVLIEKKPFDNTAVHDIEAFGPVTTLMPYNSLGEAIQLSHMGRGSLCCSIVTNDDHEAREFAIEAATHHGRILILNRENAKHSTGHGSPLPSLIHGGPGRAGGGEEMGGMLGVKHYLQRCAIQATPTTMTAVTGVYQAGSRVRESDVHPFRYYFEDIEIGMSLLTHKRTITDSDIQNFANLTWDVFYAHTDITSLEGSIFERRAAHGYFLLAAAAGLFVHPSKGPVGANYGLDDCRFLRPVYHNDTIQVRLTCKEKVDRDSRGKEHPAGVVKWYVEVFDEDMELVAMATILTLVRKKSPFLDFNIKTIENLTSNLKENTQPKWGIMTAQHMIEHLDFFNQIALSKIAVEQITPEENVEKYQESLYNHTAIPKNFKLSILKKDDLEDLRYDSLKEARAAFILSLREVMAFFKSHPSATVFNPTFGHLNKYEWKLYCQKHFQHHFEQFGLL